MKVRIIHIYFGKLPAWFNSFVTSCKYNNHLDFLLLTDNIDFKSEVKNISAQFFTVNDFNKLASENLGFTVSLYNSYKLCEFKPAFGVIFKQFLKGYDYWGYCDNDLLFGDMKQFLSLSDIEKYDVISTYSNFMSGPICFYRNIAKINTLYAKIYNYQKVYKFNEWCGSEENFIGLPGLKAFIFNFFRRIGFFFFNSFKKGATPQLKFINYWVYKQLRMRKNIAVDISEVVWQENTKGNLKALFIDLLKSDREYARVQKNDWKLRWEKGKLYTNYDKNEIFSFHFVDSKSKPGFIFGDTPRKDLLMLTKSGLK